MMHKNWKVTAIHTNGKEEIIELYYTNNAITEARELQNDISVVFVSLERIPNIKTSQNDNS